MKTVPCIRNVVTLLALLFLGLASCLNAATPAEGLLGSWQLTADGGGAVPEPGVTVTLNFSSGGLDFASVGGGQNIHDSGSWSVDGNLITLSLPGLGKQVNQKRFSRMGNVLVLPFKVYSDDVGISSWQRSGTGSSGGSSGSDSGGGSGSSGGKGSDGDSGGKGNDGNSGSGNDGNSGNDGSAGGKGSDGSSGDDGDSDKGEKGDKGDRGSDGRSSREQDKIDRKTCILAGNYEGRAAGEEVRFRHVRGLLVLTVKHSAEFFFHVDGKGQVEGEGTITYDMTKDTQGLDKLAAGVQGMMGMMPMASAPSGGGAKSALADKAAGTITSGVSGVNSLQYDAPHLKNGPELRHFKFKGHVVVNMTRNGGEIFVEQDGDFTLTDGTVDNKLISAWEVNLQKEQSTFPCWSPFTKGAGVFRKGPGGLWVIEFMEKGTHRDGKKPWQEYAYYWTARLNR